MICFHIDTTTHYLHYCLNTSCNAPAFHFTMLDETIRRSSTPQQQLSGYRQQPTPKYTSNCHPHPLTLHKPQHNSTTYGETIGRSGTPQRKLSEDHHTTLRRHFHSTTRHYHEHYLYTTFTLIRRFHTTVTMQDFPCHAYTL